MLLVDNLSVSFDSPEGEVRAVRGVSLRVEAGESLAIVGESGCGKSVLCKAILGLLPRAAHVTGGRVLLDGVDVTRAGEKALRRLRGPVFSMVLQNPLSALNPTLTIGAQISEAVNAHGRRPKTEVRERVEALLTRMGLPGDFARRFPGQLSGGQRQRAVIAIALAQRPKLLFADEPTTALDPDARNQVLELLGNIQRREGTALVLVTHDLSAARNADRVAVMYAGKIVETGTTRELFDGPRHPYTWGLLQALPERARAGEPLYTIPGGPPSLAGLPPGDPFAWRNPYALEIDYLEEPPMFAVSPTHAAATWLLDPRAPQVQPPYV